MDSRDFSFVVKVKLLSFGNLLELEMGGLLAVSWGKITKRGGHFSVDCLGFLPSLT